MSQVLPGISVVPQQCDDAEQHRRTGSTTLKATRLTEPLSRARENKSVESIKSFVSSPCRSRNRRATEPAQVDPSRVTRGLP